MRTAFPGETVKTSKLLPNQLDYYNWLKHLKHQKLKVTKQEVKQEDKQQYDKHDKTRDPVWEISDQ